MADENPPPNDTPMPDAMSDADKVRRAPIGNLKYTADNS